MYSNSFSNSEDYFNRHETSFTKTTKPEKGFTFKDKAGTRHEYLESDRGGHTEYSGPTSCYYDEFGES